MERLSIAIAKARDTASQARLEQTRNAMDGASPPAAAAAVAAATATVQAVRKRNPWTLTIAVLLGLAAMTAFWAMRQESGTAPFSNAMQAEAASAPQASIATTAQVSEPALPASAGGDVPAGAEEPPAATAAAESDPPASPLNEQVEAAVEAWRQAWSARNMTAYLSAYSEAFTPPAGMSRKDWIASRYRNVGGRTSIVVQIKDLEVQLLEDGRARATFLQDYTSGSTRETAEPKTLDLVRDADDRWRIVGEWQGDPPPLPEALAQSGKS